jgi:hypothetical protein
MAKVELTDHVKRQGVEKRSERWQNKARKNEKAEFTFE